MSQHRLSKALIWLSAAGLLWVVGTQTVRGQYTQNREPIHVDTSTYPPAMKRAYQLFSNRCGECHSVDLSLKTSFAPPEWASVIEQMQARPSSHINDREAETILSFLNYYDSHQVTSTKPVGSSSPTAESVAAGRKLYSVLSCNACHSIAGNGGSVGPALDGVGAKLSRSQLIDRLKGKPPSQIMPALPASTTNGQLNDLVDYLLTLRGGMKK